MPDLQASFGGRKTPRTRLQSFFINIMFLSFSSRLPAPIFKITPLLPSSKVPKKKLPQFPPSRRLKNEAFYCATMTRRLDAISRLDVSQWIEAHGHLSARTTLRHNWMVTPESPDRVMWTQCNPAPFNRRATNMRYQANRFKLFL